MRPTRFPFADFLPYLLEEKEFIVTESGHVIKRTADVWVRLTNKLKSVYEASPDYLQTIVCEDRFGALDQLLGPDVELPNTENGIETAETVGYHDDEDDCVPSESDDFPGRLDLEKKRKPVFNHSQPSKNFVITFSEDEWYKMRPEEVTYLCKARMNYRHYTVLKRTWTQIVNRYFWQHTKCECKLNNTGGRVSTSGAGYYVRVMGVCTYCKSVFTGAICDEPRQCDPVLMQCTFRGPFEIEHPVGLKRHLSGPDRVDVLKKVRYENVSSSEYVRLQADKIMTFGDKEPAHLPKPSVIRNAKYESARRDRLHDDPILALCIAMHNTPYRGVIRDVSYDKFKVHFWSSSEIHIYRSYCAQNTIPVVSIDATGGVVKGALRCTGERSSHIMLYRVVVRDVKNDMQFSVCNMLSERQDTESIRHWLGMWIRDGAPIPKVVVVDMSLALVSACSQAFALVPSIAAYAETCANILFSDKDPSFLPPCYIRNDVAHTVKLVSQLPSLRGTIRRTNNFYKCVIGQNLQFCDISDIRNLCLDLFIVALSETEGLDGNTGKTTPCEESKLRLIKRIGRAVVNVDEDDCNDDFIGESHFKHNPFVNWMKKIAEDAESRVAGSTGERGNKQYLPALVNDLIRLSSLLPFSTAVMVPFYGYGEITASSASVQSHFNDVKNRVFQDVQLPIRVDEFVLDLIKSSEGRMKVTAARTSKSKKLDEQLAYPDNTTKDALEKKAEATCDVTEATAKGIKLDSATNSSGMPEGRKINAKFADVEHVLNASARYDKESTEQSGLQCTDGLQGTFPNGPLTCTFCGVTLHDNTLCFRCDGEGNRCCTTCEKKSDFDRNTLKERQEVENSKGLSVPLKKRKIASSADVNSEWLRTDLSSSNGDEKIGLLKNGSRSKLKPLRLKNGTKLLLSNTCGIDALIQILCVAICDSDRYCKFVEANSSCFSLGRIATQMVKQGVSLKTYRLRGDAVLPHFPSEELPMKVKLVKCEGTMSNVARVFFRDFPSATETCACSSPQCKNCDSNYKIPAVCLVFPSQDLPDLEKRVALMLNCNKKCACTGTLTISTSLSRNHLLLEVIIPSSKRSADCCVQLRGIPPTLSVSKNMYYIRGVVGYWGSGNPSDLGHFVAFCRRENGLWGAYHDLKDKKFPCSANKYIQCQIFVYTE